MTTSPCIKAPKVGRSQNTATSSPLSSITEPLGCFDNSSSKVVAIRSQRATRKGMKRPLSAPSSPSGSTDTLEEGNKLALLQKLAHLPGSSSILLHKGDGVKGELKPKSENAATVGGEYLTPQSLSPSTSNVENEVLEEEDEDYPKTITVQLARCRLPYRWAEPLPEFKSCLSGQPLRSNDLGSPGRVLRGAITGDILGEESWLSSAMTDLVLSHFAKNYTNVHFMASDFSAMTLKGCTSREDMLQCTDIRGRLIDYESKYPVIFLANILNHHWNLIRVSHSPLPELQLFEPMGKPAKRQTGSTHARSGVGHRHVTKELINWLNECYPLSGIDAEGWTSCSCSAITSQQQTTGFDCGVATLLYAEKCGQGQMREDIDASTTQDDLTNYRSLLRSWLQQSI